MSKPNPNQSAIAFAGAFQDLVRETVRAEVAPLRADVGGLGEYVGALRADVETLSNKVDFMGGELKKLKEFTVDGFREVNEKIADMMTPA